MNIEAFEDRLRRINKFYSDVVSTVPQLKRGRVWCHSCGAELRVSSAQCLRSGWPRCCGQTVSIDSPKERRP